MARTHFSIPNTDKTEQSFTRWFSTNGYSKIAFENGVWQASLGDTMQGAIYHKLKEKPGTQTFAKESTGRSLLVFEVKPGNPFEFECYSPLLIFGIFRKELKFNPKAGFLTSYLKSGYADMMSLQNDV